jgi:hypothetical protein
MEWYEAVEIITPYVVRITTPQGSGTGFMISRTKDGSICGIATAAHVIDQAHFWEQPIRVQGADDGGTMLLRQADRAIFLDEDRDTAAIVFEPTEIALPVAPLPVIKEGYMQKIGSSIGWLGYPSIGAPNLCFFSGVVSAWVQESSAYFVDGVAINGVSGGPAFAINGKACEFIGVVSAYMPNRVTGETLPGLGIVRDVHQFHALIRRFKSVDEAKAKESPAPPSPPPPTPSAEGWWHG